MTAQRSHQPQAVATAPTSKPAAGTQPFAEHIRELRSRLFWVVAAFIVSSAVAYQFRDALVAAVLAPLGHEKLIYLTPGGGFSFIFQVTMYAGLLVTAPFLVHQLYRFVAPALPSQARRHTAVVFLASCGLMLAGAAFGYLVAVPAALTFLTTFAGDYVTASLTADSYLSFVIGYVVGLGLLFQLPLLLLFWHWIKPLTPGGLLNSERYVIILAFVSAALITPTPDVVNQTMIALPILLIYQVGVGVVLIMIYRSRKQQRTWRAWTPTLELPSDADLAQLLAHEPAAPQVVAQVTEAVKVSNIAQQQSPGRTRPRAVLMNDIAPVIPRVTPRVTSPPDRAVAQSRTLASRPRAVDGMLLVRARREGA